MWTKFRNIHTDAHRSTDGWERKGKKFSKGKKPRRGGQESRNFKIRTIAGGKMETKRSRNAHFFLSGCSSTPQKQRRR